MNVGYGVTVYCAGVKEGRLDGIGYYTYELASALQRLNSSAFVPVAFRGDVETTFLGADVKRWPRYGYVAGISALAGVRSIGCQFGESRVDLFHSTDHLMPKLRGVPHVATIMDAIPLAHPEWGSQRLRNVKNYLWRRASKWPDHVITISNYSKGQLVEHFGLCPDKISVTPLGVNERYFERFDQQILAECRKRLGIPGNYYLFVGTLQPRKNLGTIVNAHLALPSSVRKEFPLVVVGREGWGSEDWRSLLSEENIFWLQGVDDHDKRALLQGATAMVFPSLSEGFGLPLLEAFASNLPVISSNSSSLPEVAGEAAILVDPLDVEAWQNAMLALAHDLTLATRLKIAGQSRARLFSWDACARATFDVYRQVI